MIQSPDEVARHIQLLMIQSAFFGAQHQSRFGTVCASWFRDHDDRGVFP